MEGRKDWILEVVRCAAKAHDSAGMAMVSDDASIGDRDPLGRLVAIVEIGVLNGWVTGDGEIVPEPMSPPAPADRVTAEELAEVARLDAAATPRPWSAQDTPGQVWTAPDDDGMSEVLIAEGLEDGDQAFVVAARTLLPKLAKALEDEHGRHADTVAMLHVDRREKEKLAAELTALREKALAADQQLNEAERALDRDRFATAAVRVSAARGLLKAIGES